MAGTKYSLLVVLDGEGLVKYCLLAGGEGLDYRYLLKEERLKEDIAWK